MIGVSVAVDDGGLEFISEAAVVEVEEVLGDGLSVDCVEFFSGVPAGGADGGLEGVLAAEGEGVDAAFGTEKSRLSLISPYSFHSSTSSRSFIPASIDPPDYESKQSCIGSSPRRSSPSLLSPVTSSSPLSCPRASLLSHL